ncbi:MATE family efflux transporter [Aliivibrio finisterrensis]|uniref:MATE family efflux transporter n=1 Tax=Aliivibrio finisterrensis TaxID=511998 RepID=UPI00102178C9|nr:MATE family efflux transporter [Aliivibrio finisterrensis]RYU68688.1 MATE family efflux transporter [Aliivibrio finisterrensis]RYU72906.1 MATE family efflux transporter [Aliivibrio finisterrensis]RYU75232.1 MATE family efflux transporter [Aliivibrio finisterrensis]
MKKILALAFPLIISQLISMALVLTDVWMMSRLNMSALAGGGLGASVYFFIFIIASSTVGCVANLIAIAYGQRLARPDYGNRQIRLAVKGAVLLSVILSVLLMFSFSYAPTVLKAANQPDEMITLAMEYVHALKWVMFPSLILLVLRGLTSALGNVRSIMVMSIITVFLNVPISYLLTFQFGMGLTGLGIGTAIAAFVVMIGYGAWVFKQTEYKPFAPWLNREEYSIKLIFSLLAMGLPIGIAALLEHGLIYGGTLMAGTISVASLALHQILLQCLSFTWNFNFGFSQAAAILVGRDFGSENHDGIKQTSWHSFILVTVMSVGLSLVFIIWPELIADLFQLDDGSNAMSGLLASVIWVVALCFIVDAWQLLAINLLRGMKIVSMPTVMTAIGYWVFGLPAAWFLMPLFGLAGIWAGIGIGLGITGILLLIQLLISVRHYTNKRRNNDFACVS